MKCQLVVTVEFDGESRTLAHLSPPSPAVVLADLNRELRLWQGSNPYSLTDPEHLTVRLALADGREGNGLGAVERHALADDIGRIAEELHALRRLARAG